MRSSHARAVLVLVTALVGLGSSAVAQDDPALDFLRGRHDAALRLLERPASESRDTRVSAIIDGLLDVETMTRESCGASWDAMTEAQRTELVTLITTVTRTRYRRVLDQMGDWDVVWVGATVEGTDHVVTLRARPRDEPRAEPTELGFRMREVGGAWRVIDTITNDVSTTRLQRTNFATVVRRDGIEGLLANARELVARETRGASEPD